MPITGASLANLPDPSTLKPVQTPSWHQNVNDWFKQNPNATYDQMKTAATAAGGSLANGVLYYNGQAYSTPQTLLNMPRTTPVVTNNNTGGSGSGNVTTTPPPVDWTKGVEDWLNTNKTATFKQTQEMAKLLGGNLSDAGVFSYNNQGYVSPTLNSRLTTNNTSNTNNYLTSDDLTTWWNNLNRTNSGGNGSYGSDSLSNLYPRVNWGNYQGTNRGSRYFDTSTGNYQALGNMYQTS